MRSVAAFVAWLLWCALSGYVGGSLGHLGFGAGVLFGALSFVSSLVVGWYIGKLTWPGKTSNKT